MIYAVSDIHGCYDKYKKLLKKINFGPDDTIYVLGDVIDRGPDGFKILLDMARRPNVINLMGNHEAMAIRALSHILCDPVRGTAWKQLHSVRGCGGGCGTLVLQRRRTFPG